jgi:hypothetical protein
MTPLLPGLLVLAGYVWIGGWGILLGLGAGIAWAVWWYRRNDRRFFPRDVRTAPFVISIVLTVVAFILALVAT